VAAFCSAVAIFDVWNVLYTDPVIVPDPKKWHGVADKTILPCEMVLLSISLACAYCYLSANIQRHFAKELQKEGNKIKAIFVLFSLSYISRAAVYLLL